MIDPSERKVPARSAGVASALIPVILTVSLSTMEVIKDFMTMEVSSDPFSDKGTLRATEQTLRVTPRRSKGGRETSLPQRRHGLWLYGFAATAKERRSASFDLSLLEVWCKFAVVCQTPVKQTCINIRRKSNALVCRYGIVEPTTAIASATTVPHALPACAPHKP
jgi:hypothetical protein